MNNWFRYGFTVVILLSLCAQHAGKLLLVADYYANTALYLAKCENLSRPQLHCNGQCLLMKKMQKAESREAQAPEKKLEWKLEVLSRKSFYSQVIAIHGNLKNAWFVPFTTGSPVDYAHSLFRPPAIG